jgi:streptogramin lyase
MHVTLPGLVSQSRSLHAEPYPGPANGRPAPASELFKGHAGTAHRSGTYTGPGVSVPEIIVPGPDGAMWFANHGSASVGRITTRVTPKITKFTPGPAHPGPP